jgi:hypothetical protein
MLNRFVDVGCGSVDFSTLTSDLIQKCQSAASLSKSLFDDVCLRQSSFFYFLHIALKKYWVFPDWFTRKCFYREKKYIIIYMKTKNRSFQVSAVKQIRSRHFPLCGRKVTRYLVI